MQDLISQLAELGASATAAAIPGSINPLRDSPLRALLDAVPYGILLFGADRRLIFANAAGSSALAQAGRHSSVPLEHLSTVFPFYDPGTELPLTREQGPVSRALRGEAVVGEEFLVGSGQTGLRFWLEVHSQPLRDAEGTVVAVLFTFREIGARKRRELELEATGKLLGIIYQENLAGIVRSTLDGRLLDCNEAIVRMLGYTERAQFLEVPAAHIYYEAADRERLMALLGATQRVSEFEVRLRRADDSPCWVLLNARVVSPQSGEGEASLVAIIVDISERRAQEETLRKSEQRFAAFMHHLPGIAFIKDPEGRYIYFNETAWTQFGVRPEDIAGKTDEEIWPAENAALYRASDAAVMSSGRPAEFLEPIVHPDGVHSWLIYKFPILQEGVLTLVGGVGIDITERMLLEDQLAQARKMEALGRLAGGVAHDFNNLLTVIAGYGQLAIENLVPARSDAGRSRVPVDRIHTYLREILDSARRASGLTSQLLAFSRREVSQPRIVNLGSLLQGMDRLLQRVIGEHVELTMKADARPCLVLADPTQLEQAVMNLCVNSRDAMPLGGTLELRCRVVASGTVEEGAAEEVLLEVQDDGIGMDEFVRAQIFDPFFTSKEPGRGTGLGLSSVYAVVTEALGRIEVESEPGEGTVFRLWFPLAKGVEDDQGTPENVEPMAARETVLLVEDEAAVRDLAEIILERLGYTVLVADCAMSALLIWQQHSADVDLLLTDVIMPNISGAQLADVLREQKPGLRVLFMSGYTDDMLAGHGVLSGETQLIHKPFTVEALARKLRAVLDA